MNGRLISFEGIDGSGKSTQAARACEWLRAKGLTVRFLREPGGTTVGELIRSILLDRAHTGMSSRAELLLYLAARAQLMDESVIPALERGEIVILDRFIDSSTAYQGYARGVGAEATDHLNRFATGGVVPHLTILVDCDPRVAFSRMTGDHDRLEAEGLSFMERVREGFLAIAADQPDRVMTIDGKLSVEAVWERVQKALEQVLPAVSGV